MIIAEIGLSHDGNIDMAHSYIDALSDRGIDVIKFQTHIAEAESSEYEKFRIRFSDKDNTRYDYWRRTEFTYNQWSELKSHCDEIGLKFLSTPFSLKAVDLLEKLDVEMYKIGSGDMTNYPLLKKVGDTNKPVIISTGMSSHNEISESINFIGNYSKEISLMQCTSAYPTSLKEWGLNVIKELKVLYNIPVGFSDHSGSIYPCLAAAALGSDLFEFHVVFDRNQFGPDTNASITIDQVALLTEGIRQIQSSINFPVDKNDIESFKVLRELFGRSLSLNKNKKAGDIINFDDLESKKPAGYGIPAKEFEKIVLKTLNKNLEKWSFINWEDID